MVYGMRRDISGVDKGLGGIFDVFSAGKTAATAATATAQRADAAIQEAQGAIRQGRETLTTVSRIAEGMEAYVRRIQNIPIEELARRFDYKTKIAVEELLTLSGFMKKSLLYLAGLATLSIYLNILTRKQ